MSTVHRTADVDPITYTDLQSLGTAPGPAVSVFMPTDRSGPETREGPLRLRSLLDRAETGLVEGGTSADEAAQILAPLRELEQNPRLWQRVADGLALYASRETNRWFRVAVDLPEEVHVGDSFAVRPLVPLVVGDGGFLILALSQNSVRLFEASREFVRERGIGGAPTSMAEAEGQTDREPQLQHQAAPSGTATYHGHGAGGEVDRVMLEKFLRQVASGIDDELGGDEKRPLVLAAVAEHLPVLRDALSYGHLLDDVAAGNPDEASAAELHQNAWPIAEPVINADAAALADRFGEALGTGLGLSEPGRILTAAQEGRVDTLLLTSAMCRAGEVPDDLDDAVGHTLATSGTLAVIDELPHGAAVGAILRY